MIEVQHLTKKYGNYKAVDDISFSVSEGEVLGFLGPNGAGKSTTMNILTGYLSATLGAVSVNGFDVLEEPNKAKVSIGYLPEQPPLYLDMTVAEYLNFIYDLKKCKLTRNEHIAEVCKTMKIQNVYPRLLKNLSKGYRQRVGFAQALIGNPPVLILDEPTVGLDPTQIIEIRSLIKDLGKKHTVILSSHILQEIEATCDRVVIINQGKIAADATIDELAKKYSADHRLIVRVAGPAPEVVALITGIHQVEKVEPLGEKEVGVWEYALTVSEGADVRRELFRRLSDRNWPLLGLRSMQLSLEEVFLKLTMEQNVLPVEMNEKEEA